MMTENIKIDFLKNIQLFSSLTDEELSRIGTRITIEEFKKNEVVLREEDTSEYMYIILFGKVKVIQTTEDGKEIILAVHKADDFFGEVSLIDGKTSPATVQTQEDSLIAFIAKKDFTHCGTQSKKCSRRAYIFCSRLRESWRDIYAECQERLDRVKLLFLTLSHKNGSAT
jgi:CRP/FNR family transcriptional regulator